MGDYTKLIVNCSVKKMKDEELEQFKTEFLDKIYVGDSAYHCGGDLVQFSNDWGGRTDITLVTQTKYGRNQEEFLEWLEPQVIAGCGDGDAWAMRWTEYQREPDIKYLRPKE